MKEGIKMDCKISVKLHSEKATVKIENIVVPKCFGTPKIEKIIYHCETYFGEFDGLEPIIVDDSLTLMDGYISLLILKAQGKKTADVFKITPKAKFIGE